MLTISDITTGPGYYGFPRWIEADRLRFEAVVSTTLDRDTIHTLFHDLDDPDDVFTATSWSHHTHISDTVTYLHERYGDWEDTTKAEYVVLAPPNPTDPLSLTVTIDGTEYSVAGTMYYTCPEETDGVSTSGFWLRKPYWGHGYFGEWADTVTAVRFDVLDVELVRFRCRTDNHRSFAALTDWLAHHGGVYEGTIRQSSGDDAVHMFTLSAEEYEQEATGITTNVPIPFDEIYDAYTGTAPE